MPPFPQGLCATNLEVGMVAIGESGVHLVHRHRVHARHLVLLLPLHPAVLEPDLDLPLRQAERVRNLDPEDELHFLQLLLFDPFLLSRYL